MKNDVSAYFDQKADRYQHSSTRFPWSWIRTREVAVFFELLGDASGKEVLELGSGSGFYSRHLVESGAEHVYAVDLSPRMAKNTSGPKITAIEADAAQVALERTFELIVAAGLLEFVDSPELIFKNANTHAAAGTRLIIVTPYSNVFGYLYKQYHRINGLQISLFTVQQISKMAQKYGWQIVDRKFVWPFTMEYRLDMA